MSRAEAAKIGGMDRQTLRDWVHRFNQHGPDGLKDNRRPGNPRRLSKAQQLELAALALPFADTEMMQLQIDEISLHVAKGAHAVVLLDRAGWHIAGDLVWPENITPMLLPSRSPELNPVENIWRYLRANYLSNRVFETYNDIIDAACDAWKRLTDRPDVITSIGIRQRVRIGQV